MGLATPPSERYGLVRDRIQPSHVLLARLAVGLLSFCETWCRGCV